MGCLGAPGGLGALGPGPPGPLDKTALSLPTDIRSAPTLCIYFQESAQDSFVFTVVFCTLSFINLIRVAYVVRRPRSDFTDMLRRHINCRIIIVMRILSVRPSVCLSVCPSVTRVDCDKTVERCVQIYIPHERS